MRVLVVGATGGSGRAAIEALVASGHEVTAFSRSPDALAGPGVIARRGDATRGADVRPAVAGQDAVIVTLGIRESALRVRLLGSGSTPMDVRSRGTGAVIGAMREHGVKRLVVQTSFGVGETRDRLGALDRAIFALLLRPQIADTEVQERAIRESGLDWVIAQPVHLTDGTELAAFASPQGDTRGRKVSRRAVGRFLAQAVESPTYVGRSVALSAE